MTGPWTNPPDPTELTVGNVVIGETHIYEGSYTSPNWAITDSAIIAVLPPPNATPPPTAPQPGAIFAEGTGAHQYALVFTSPWDADAVGDAQASILVSNRGSGGGTATISMDGDTTLIDTATTQVNGVLDVNGGLNTSSGAAAKVLTHLVNQQATGGVTVGASGTTPVDLTGATITLNLPTGAIFRVTGTFDMNCTTTGATAIGTLSVAGSGGAAAAVSNETCPFNATAAGERITATQTWQGTVTTGGLITLKLQGSISTGTTARYGFGATNTKLSVEVFEI